MAPAPDRSLASVRAAEIVVAALLLAAALLVIADSVRVGIRWADDGPEAGYFPFYVGVLLAFASAWTLGAALVRRAERKVFVTAGALRAIATMLVPTIVYVAVLAWLGLYVASFLYIAFFMVAIGRYSRLRSLGVAASVSVIAFLLFEIWFMVPLPKGPLEAALGLQ